MRLDLAELERIARAAEQDEWEWDSSVLEGVHNGQVVMFADTDEPEIIASVPNKAHIAANSPPVTLALIARIRELESLADELAGVYVGEGYPQDAVRVRALLEKGVLLP